MVSPLATGVFRELQKMLPGLPEKVIHIEIKTGIDCPPTVTCAFYASGVPDLLEYKTFDIVDSSECVKAPLTRPAETEAV